jgi:hypothetical protein
MGRAGGRAAEFVDVGGLADGTVAGLTAPLRAVGGLTAGGRAGRTPLGRGANLVVGGRGICPAGVGRARAAKA